MATHISRTIMVITITDTASLLRLMSWLSPAFPTGGFAYSAGLEQAVHAGLANSETTLGNWIACTLEQGALWNDAVFLSAAVKNATQQDALHDLSDRAIAMAGSRERLAEITNQGTSFVEAAANWFAADALPPRGTPLCICIGVASGLSAIAPQAAIAAFLHAYVSNQLQCAIRLSVMGQSGAARLLAKLEPTIDSVATRAATASLDDLGTATIMADIAAMNHETLQPRLFLS